MNFDLATALGFVNSITKIFDCDPKPECSPNDSHTMQNGGGSSDKPNNSSIAESAKEKANSSESRKSYGFRDPVVRHVVDKFVSRSDVGFEKYGSTLDDERRLKMKGLTKYLNDVQEELMDAILYIQAAREELQDLSEEALIDKFRYDEEEI